MSKDVLPVEHVSEVLAPHGIKVQRINGDTSTAPLAAAALNTPVSTIVKSLLFFADDEPVLVLAAGDRRVNTELLASELGSNALRLARPGEVIRVAGYAVGGVPPLGHRTRIRTLLDDSLLSHPVVYAAAGASDAIFPVEPVNLQVITGAEITSATD